MTLAPQHNRRRTRDTAAGFTLIEALIAIIVLSFGLIAISNLSIFATTSNIVANRASAATMLASQQLEFFRSQPFGSPLLAASPVGVDTLEVQTPNYFTPVPIVVDGVGQFETRWLIQNVNATTLFIAVRTEPRGFRARAARAEFTTIRTQR